MQGMYMTFYDVTRGELVGDKPLEGAEYPPKLAISITNGQPGYMVYTGIKGVSIRFGCNSFTMNTIMNKIIEMSERGEPGTSISVTSEKPERINGQPTGNQNIVSYLVIGKSKSGITYLMLKQDGKPDIPFALLKNNFHNFRTESGDNFDPITQSKDFARSYAEVTKHIVKALILEYQRDLFNHSDRKPHVMEPFDPNKFKKKGSGMTKVGNSNIPAPSSDLMAFDEDIPM